MKRTLLVALLIGCGLSSGGANAAPFVNGNFETGTAAGWTIGGGDRTSVLNNALNPAAFLPGGSLFDATIASTHSSIVTPGIDPNTVNPAGGPTLNRVFNGNFSWRVEDTTNGGFASVLSQAVQNYTDPNIFFAWAAVLEGAHGVNDAATMIISLRDTTAGTELIRREFNAASGGSGVDPRFIFNPDTNYFWTPWQTEQLTLPQTAIGHDFLLTILASDCEPTGHVGYAYVDGFGGVTPPVIIPGPNGTVPVPPTLALLGLGFVVMGALRRRRS